MRRVILVEDAIDYKIAWKYFSDNHDFRESLVISCNEGTEIGSVEAGWTLKSESDYYSALSLDVYNITPHETLRSWLADPQIASLFTLPPHDLSCLFLYELGRALSTTFKYVDLLKVILRKENPETLYYIDWPSVQPESLRIRSKDKIVAGLIGRIHEALRLEFPSLKLCPITPPSFHVSAKLYKPDFSKILRSGLSLFQRWLNWKLLQRSGVRKKILFKGAPRLMFALMRKVNAEPEMNAAYYQSQASPRLMRELYQQGSFYWQPVYSRCRDSGADIWNERRTLFFKLIEKKDFFVYGGINLRPFLKTRFDFIFENLLPDSLRRIAEVKQLLRAQAPLGVIVDEENSLETHFLLLAARELKIPSLEYQHGAIYHYHLQARLVQHYLVWGRFFKEKMIRELGIEDSEATVVGPLHLAALLEKVNSAQKKDVARDQAIRAQLGVSEGRRIALFTTHSFNKGSRGGLYQVHMTREEVTTMLSCITDAMAQTKGWHLIIKLHHEDHNVGFYEQTLAHFKGRFSFTILRHTSIHDLIQVSSFLITPPSTTVLEAVFWNKPILLFDPGQARKNVFPFAQWQAVSYACDSQAFQEKFNELIMASEKELAAQQQGRQQILREFADMEEASTGHAFMSVIRTLCGEQQESCV